MRKETHESRHSRLLELRNAELAAPHTVGEFYIVGGVVMCIALDARDASLTIDAFFKPARLVREAAARVAAASRISDKWLNDAVKPVRPESVPTPSPIRAKLCHSARRAYCNSPADVAKSSRQFQLELADDRLSNALGTAVAEALNRKRRLGQYAVIWRDGQVVRINPDDDAPPSNQMRRKKGVDTNSLNYSTGDHTVRDEAIFLNGVYGTVLEDILKIQKELPEHIMFLQPYAKSPIVRLRDEPPSINDSVQLYLSTTDDLPTVAYSAEIVGWDDKTEMSDDKRRVISRLIFTLQPTEDGLYDASGDGSGTSTNLLHVRRMVRLEHGFSVMKLIKTSDQTPVSPNRSTAGGWSYVRRVEE